MSLFGKDYMEGVIFCPSCGGKITPEKGIATMKCPMCNTVIDVANAAAKQSGKEEGLVSVIKYEGGNDVFVWKHPIEDFNIGSQLIVHESQEAVFLRDGEIVDVLGPGRHTLVTANIPFLERILKLGTAGKEIFHAEIYFVNMSTQMGVKWGTDSRVRMFDPASGIHIELGACGNFNIRVSDSKTLIRKIVGTSGELSQSELMGGYGTNAMVGKFRALVMNKAKASLARTIKEQDVNILEVDSYLDLLSEKMAVTINENLQEYGLVMPEFYITRIDTPDDDPNFIRLKQQYADKTLLVREEGIRKAQIEAATQTAQAEQGRKMVEAETEQKVQLVQAQTEAQARIFEAQGEAEAVKLQGTAQAEAYKAQAFAEAEEMKAKGYTYAQETARQVGTEAMKNGITGGGNGGGSGIGDVVGLGVTLGAMGGVIGMTKEALDPIMGTASGVGAGVGGAVAGTIAGANDTWNCPSCGAVNIKSKFCPDCGAKKPEPVVKETDWSCPACGTTGITSKFCPNCGAKKPEQPVGWTCPNCGKTDIQSRFCPDCGAGKPE